MMMGVYYEVGQSMIIHRNIVYTAYIAAYMSFVALVLSQHGLSEDPNIIKPFQTIQTFYEHFRSVRYIPTMFVSESY